MRALALLTLATLLLAGCTTKGPSLDDAAAATFDADPSGPGTEPASVVRFASGDSEGSLAGVADFGPGDACAGPGACAGAAVQSFDLTSIIPADAPVELTVGLPGNAKGELRYQDASPVSSSTESSGQRTDMTAVLSRAAAGTVTLAISHAAFAEPAGGQVPWTAHAVVRAALLVPGMPASLPLQPGDVLDVTADGVDDAILIAPDGTAVRDGTRPFLLRADGAAGTYVLLVHGDGAIAVRGPDVTMAARRLALVEGPPHALTSGGATTWTLTEGRRPLAVGLHLGPVPNPGNVVLDDVATSYDYSVTSPGGAVVVQGQAQCGGLCGFQVGGTFDYGNGTAFLDERLAAGDYTYSASCTGNGLQASDWALLVL